MCISNTLIKVNRIIVFCSFIFIANSLLGQTIQILNKCISLSIKDTISLCLNRNEQALWWSDNKFLTVNQAGRVFVNSYPKEWIDKLGYVYVKALSDNSIDSCEITIVDWIANNSKLDIVDILPEYHLLATDNNSILFSNRRGKLFKTTNGFHTKTKIGKIPKKPSNTKLLVTPLGYFLRCSNRVYLSHDLKNWKKVFQGTHDGLYHSFDFYYDSIQKKVFLYMSEYSWENLNNEHKVYRGIISSDGNTNWKTLITFYSRNSFESTPWLRPIAYHIHTVMVDPFSGNIWIGTGDFNNESMIIYSTDHGDTFHLLGMGSQDYRPLAFWFTKDYIYWNMDTYAPQSICRISRKVFNSNGICASMSPELNTGYTKTGIEYYVIKASDPEHFPVTIGKTYIETTTRELNEEHIVIPFDDSTFDYKEKVANLNCGSMWFTTKAKTRSGDEIIIMGVAGSANYFDTRNRVFGIKENPDGSVIVQELLNFPFQGNEYAQLEPKFQDKDGYIYFGSREFKYNGLYKASLIWKDSIEFDPNYKCPSKFIDSEVNNLYITYPNPSYGNFKVYCKFGFEEDIRFTFELYNMLGQLIYTKYTVYTKPSLEEEIQLSTEYLKGIYILRIRKGEESVYSEKIFLY